MTSSCVEATYYIETPCPIRDTAEVMASEQSSGTYVDVPDEGETLREQHGATIESVKKLEIVDEPTLPSTQTAISNEPKFYDRAEVVLSFPLSNIGTSLPNLLTHVAGNLFELRELTGIRLVDLSIPTAIAEAYPSPQFGIEGTRELLNVHDRPIIGTIIKPNVGLRPSETADVVETVVDAGVDFIKDDELIANPPYSPVADRIAEVMDIIDEHRNRTDREIMYACNITGDVNEMLERHDTVVESGGNCVMVSLNSVGLAGLTRLRREADVPIHGHRNGWGALSRCPLLGFDYSVYQLLYRLAGVDHLHVNGLQSKFAETDDSVIQSACACQTPITGDEDTALPAFSSRQWAGQALDTYEALGNPDLLYLAGGGIFGHPDGPTAGVAHLKQGWEAALSGIPLEEYAETHEELATAIDFYGDNEE